jgi:hypothetical protein
MTKKPNEEGCGNDGAVESVESQKQASPSFHEPLGNLANSRRDSHISTAPVTKADGKVENQEQVSHFSTATVSLMSEKKKQSAGGLRPPRRLSQQVIVVDREK